MKVLLISYYFDPDSIVGAKRTSYWFRELNQFGIECTVLTNTKQVEDRKNVHYVANTGRGPAFKKLFKDPGLTWRNDLSAFIHQLPTFDFDIVLISGGPFMHFQVGVLLKKKYGCKLVLDYRDPFANNPRFLRESGIKKWLKTRMEKRFNRNADLVLTVNHFCADLLSFPEKIQIVANGFDERDVEGIASDVTEGSIFYGGKVYLDFNLSSFIAVVKEDKNLKFVYAGNKTDEFAAIGTRTTFHLNLSYKDYLQQLARCEICLLFTGGKEFESPTKLYDYLAMNKKIVIITEGLIETGAIHEIMRNYPNVFWSENSSAGIKSAIEKARQSAVIDFDTSMFSRKESTRRLISYLRTL